MKSILKRILEILESLGRARAASVLVRQGRLEEAKRLFLNDRL